MSGRDCWQEVKNRRKMVIMYRTYKAGKAGARHYIVEGGVSEAVFWLFFVKLSKKSCLVIMHRMCKAGKAGARHYIVESGVSEAVCFGSFL